MLVFDIPSWTIFVYSNLDLTCILYSCCFRVLVAFFDVLSKSMHVICCLVYFLCIPLKFYVDSNSSVGQIAVENGVFCCNNIILLDSVCFAFGLVEPH